MLFMISFFLPLFLIFLLRIEFKRKLLANNLIRFSQQQQRQQPKKNGKNCYIEFELNYSKYNNKMKAHCAARLHLFIYLFIYYLFRSFGCSC